MSEVMLPEDLAASVDLPEKDHPILAGALSANASHPLTGDRRHFGRSFSRSLEGVLVQAPARYLQESVDRRDRS